MNNLELKTIGVQEMDTNEMINVEGGSFLRVNGLFTWLYEKVKSIF